MVPGFKVLKFSEDQKLRLHYDDGLVKMALRIAINSGWTHIPTPDELSDYPSLWLADIFRLNEEVRRQIDIIEGAAEA